ncbi:hypothetical protein GWI72_10875 [Microvirga tunisiensis]|uniref:Uncharacterized protein n=1 Tax=Pannonibacter tanglangensis TaxID=2750084 RepID=A0A7X5F2W9_9HYPH|nr:hypothetical protein [Pannonibacter sp. XCT-53]NBN78770.1 hypothetical protein [Pannonibacter sp. XCT-53]
MVELRKRLVTLDDFYCAAEGYTHLPPHIVTRFLIETYLVDLDLIKDFAADLDQRQRMPAAPARPYAALAA